MSVLSEYLAKVLSVEKEVMAFRRRYLGSTTRTLDAHEVPRILSTWALPDDAQGSDDDVFLYWANEEGHETHFRGARGSAIGELDRLGEHFAKRYP